MQRYGNHCRTLFSSAVSYPSAASFLRVTAWWLVAIGVFGGAACADDRVGDPVSVAGGLVEARVEVLWASESPRRWVGSIAWTEPPNIAPEIANPALVRQVHSPVLMGAGPSFTAGVLDDGAGGLVFGPPSRLKMVPVGEGSMVSVQTTAGGISFRVRGQLSDRLTLRVDGDDGAAGLATSFTLADLFQGLPIEGSVTPQARVQVRRVAAGDLRVCLGRAETIFWAEQSATISLVNPMALPGLESGAALVLDCLTFASDDDRLVSRLTFPVFATVAGLDCPQARWVSPAEHGTYRVRFRLREAPDQRRSGFNPASVAQSLGRSLSTSIPLASSLPQSIRSTGTATAPAIDWMAQGFQWLPSPVEVVLAETTLSVAVIASDPEEPLIASAAPSGDAAESKIDDGHTTKWVMVGSGTPRSDASTVSRLFTPTSQWLAAQTTRRPAATPAVYDGQRLQVIEPGQQLELAIPISKVGVRHRAWIRSPRHLSLRLVAELIDIDRVTGQPQPLGHGLAIIRNGQLSGASSHGLDAPKELPIQAGGSDAIAADDSDLWHDVAIDFWPKSTVTRLVLSNRAPLLPAHLGRVDVMADETPSFTRQAPERPGRQLRQRRGVDHRLAMMRLELNDFFEQFSDHGLPTVDHPLDYHQVWVATHRLVDVLQREGYGGVLLTVSSDGAALFPDRSIIADAAWNAHWATDTAPVDALRLILRIFERQSLQVIPCLRHSVPVVDLEQKIRSDMAGHSIAARSPLAGQLGAWSFDAAAVTSFPIYNSSDDHVSEQIYQSVLGLYDRCRDSYCVASLGVLIDERSYVRSLPVVVYDDKTLNAFYATLGPDAPPRETLESWLQRSGADVFRRWQAERLRQCVERIVSQIDDRKLMFLSCDSALPPSFVELGRDRRVITSRLHRKSLTEPLAWRVRDEGCNASVPVAVGDGTPPESYFAAIFHQPLSDARRFEPGATAPTGADATLEANAVLSPDGMNASAPTMLASLVDPHESALTFAQLLHRSDRGIVAIGGGGSNQAGSDVRRRSMRTFAELPPVIMGEVDADDPASKALRVRMTTYENGVYIYAINQTRWPLVWEVNLAGQVRVQRLGPTPPQRSVSVGFRAANETAAESGGRTHSNSELALAPQYNPTTTRWQTIVQGGELVAIRFPVGDGGLVNWRATFAGSANQIATIRASVDDAVAAIAQQRHLRRRQLIVNPSFEADGAGVPGWMLAQYPTDCVAIDPSVAFDGGQSIRLKGTADRAGGSWIVSQPIAPPRSGRLAVSVRFRGARPEPAQAAKAPTEPLVVRMAVEGTVGGTPIRKSKSVTVDRDGKWGEPEWLEITRLPSLPLESLRLTIDLMSAGDVWIDDIVCYDQFMTATEKTHWEHLVFLAAGGLSRGNFIGASRLLESHWAFDLLNPEPVGGDASTNGTVVQRAAFTPSVAVGATDKPVGNRQSATDVKPMSKTEPVAPRAGWSDRLKSWLPGPLRIGS